MTTMLTALLATVGTADAAGFQAKTFRDSLSPREVERGLVNGKGWLEFGLGTDYKMADGYWDSEGEVVEFDQAQWLYTTQRLNIRYGLARRAEFYWLVKTHYVRLQNDMLGTDNDRFGFGDPRFGYRWEAYRSMAPVTSVILYADYKAPVGNETAGNYIGGPNSFEDFILTTGTPDLTLGARGKRQIGPMAITAGAAYIHRIGGIVMYLIETNENQFNARIKPGAIVQADADLLLQAGPVALHATAVYQVREETRVGRSVRGLFPSQDLEPIEGSDGWSLDLAPGAIVNVSRGVDVELAANIPMRGEDLQFWPIEDLHPTHGITYSGTFEFRY